MWVTQVHFFFFLKRPIKLFAAQPSAEHPNAPQNVPRLQLCQLWGTHSTPSVPQMQCRRRRGTPAAHFVPEWTFLLNRGTLSTQNAPQQAAEICREENGHRQ